ncbi:MAG: hypothetical protein Q7R79_04130 [bacterium]|nr:hypothetical protein [bacterium]
MNLLNERDLRVLMGSHVFGLADWASLFNVYPELSSEDRQLLDGTPWSEEFLNTPDPLIPFKRIRETHLAFIGFYEIGDQAFTIPFLQNLQSTIGRKAHITMTPDRIAHREKLFSEELFLRQTCHLRWYLMPLIVPINFRNKGFDELKSMLGNTNAHGERPYEAYEPVDTVVKTLQYVLYHQKTGHYPLQNEPLRCADSISTYRRVTVWSNAEGIQIASREDGKEYSSLALSLEHPDLILLRARTHT